NAIKNGDINSPFTKSVFIRHLILTSKTIWGEKIMEYLSLPAITTLDAYREASFSTMRALAGLFSLRAGNLKEAQEMACKSCLFATLSLEYLIGEFPIGFGNIVKLSKKIKIGPKEKKLVNIAYKMRQGKKYFSEDKMYDFIFEIMTYSAQIAEVRIKEKLEKGNKILVK
ncbi:MAG: hypothetical protein Q8O49_00140, partial [bacterium]|nr:hypothetical protein [bacterium]